MMDQRARQQMRRIAAILAELAGEIEAMGGRLCADPALMQAHVTDLQAIDLFAQKLHSLGQLVAADCPVAAVRGLQLEALRDRLHPDTLAE